MSGEKEQLAEVGVILKNLVVQKSSVTPLHGKKLDVAVELPAFDVEHHAAGFCVCCMRGE